MDRLGLSSELFLQCFFKDLCHGSLRNTHHVCKQCVIKIATIRYTAAIGRNEEFVWMLFSLICFVELVLDEFFDFLICH